MIGITIAVGEKFEKLAKVSSKCVNEMLGIETIVLTEKDYISSKMRHPTALKFKVFDFTHEENILYFDADWFCVNKWNIKQYLNDEKITICKDFVLKDDFPNQYFKNQKCTLKANFNSIKSSIRYDYVNEISHFVKLKRNPREWTNTGLWIVNRTNHLELLKLSLDYCENKVGHHKNYYEQPAMNKAMEDLNIKINYLNRTYNTLVAGRKHWPNDRIGLHIKIKRYDDFLQKILAEEIKNRCDVLNYFTCK